MAEPADGYDQYYSTKLWELLPAIYRADDSPELDRNGPLRELVNRIGAQAAIVRRSMDRMWDNQSIETCDDWIIPYIGDLLATNLVATLDGRGRRLDVAKTIYYRRRKGTVAVLEEIAADITGWEARVVEFFGRLGRYRHGLDPEIGSPADSADPLRARALQLAQGLAGPLTGTEKGGWADLRHPYGAGKAHSAFDEFFHFADMRPGRGATGWYNIPHLGVFLWRLYALPVIEGTPVRVANCPDVQFTFDPTGREVPLFAVASRPLGDEWVSPEEWQLPTPISQALLDAILAAHKAGAAFPYPNPSASLYPESLAVQERAGSFFDPIDPAKVTLWPQIGRFRLDPTLGTPELRVTYHYGFPSTIGAAALDRRALHEAPVPQPPPLQSVAGGGNALPPILAAVTGSGTVIIGDSLTYTTIGDLGAGVPVTAVTIGAANRQRPVIRVDPGGNWRTNPPQWVVHGAAGGTLTLEGLMLSGCDLVLRGPFDTVLLRQCTLDPGNAGTPPPGGGPTPIFRPSLDGRDLVPSRIWVEGGTIRQLILERCVTGPIRTRGTGAVEQLSISDSIVQSIRTSLETTPFDAANLLDAGTLALWLQSHHDPVSTFIFGKLPGPSQAALNAYSAQVQAAGGGPRPEPDGALRGLLADAFNAELTDAGFYDPTRFAGVHLSPRVQALIARHPAGADLALLNRLLLEETYPLVLADRALVTDEGTVDLQRCTVLGGANVHRLSASDCILDGVTLVDDAQEGCVRFTAWTTASVLPRPYESVQTAPDSPLFASREFGNPAYCQLTSTVDLAILASAERATISAGADNGSEMGAYNRELYPIKARSLQIKFDEYLPVGLTPAVMYVT